LALAVGGWLGTRALGVGPAATLVSRGALEEREPILLADFESVPADTLLATTITELVRIDLGQSPVIRLVDAAQIRRTLERMERDPAIRLDPALAREVAVRDGIGAYITVSLNRVRPSIVLTAELTATETETPLWTGRETASDSTEIIAAVERLSRSLRERVGESLRSLGQSAPLPQVTTSSLQALERFALANRLWGGGSYKRMLTLLEEAVAEDSTFAMAHAFIGMLMWNEGTTSVARRDKAFETAMRLSGRLPDAERYLMTGLYYAVVEDDWDRAAVEWRTLVEIRPDHALGWRALAIAYMNSGDLTRLHESNFRAAAADPYGYWWAAVQSHIILGDLDAAEAVVDSAEQLIGVTLRSLRDRAAVEANRGNWPAVKNLLSTRLEHAEGPVRQARVHYALTMAHLVGGKLDSAEVTGRTAMQLFEKAGRAAEHLSMACELADLALLRGDRDGALSEVAAARVRFPLDSLEVIDWLYWRLAHFYASVGETGEAKRLLEVASREPRRKVSGETDAGADDMTWLTPVGMVAVAEGRPQEAVDVFREEVSTFPFFRLWGPARLGLAWDSAGVADSTIAYYESYLATSEGGRLWIDAHHLAVVLERLGQLYDERGDLEKAAEHYARFVELWKEADPELQPRVRAAQQRLNEIFAEQG